MANRILIFALSLFLVACSGSKKIGSKNSGDKKPNAELFQRTFFEAQKQKAIGNTDKAYALFQDAIQIDPKNDAVYYELALYEFENKNIAGSKSNIKSALEIDKKNHWYYLLLANVEIESGDMDAAAKAFKKTAELNPDDMQTSFELARVYLYQEKFNDAIDVYDQIEKRTGISEELSFQKQQLYMQMGKPEKALEELEKLVAQYPSQIEYQGMLAQFYAESGDDKKTLEAFEKMKRIDPNSGFYHMLLSEYYATKGKDQQSYEEMLIAFQSDEVSIDEKIGVLLRFYSVTDYNPDMLPRAYKLLDITVDVHPGESKAYAMYGDYHLRENRIQEARNMYLKAVQLDKTRSTIWTQLLILESQLANWKALEEESQEAVNLFPAQPEFFLYLGISQGENGNTDEAVDNLNMGRMLVIENPGLESQFFASLGDIYHKMGEHSKSDNSYEEALRINPDNVFVLNNYAYYLSMRKENLPRAVVMAKHANEIQPGQPSFQDTYGWVLFQTGKFEEALNWIQASMDAGGDQSPEVVEHFGDALFKNNREEEALYFWQKALELGADTENLRKKIEEKTLYE
ncbi:MAG: tetratricopeptide (TPR) repeat protein [Flavobacteriales bacterium]|jgi:tetratricopeptide (TPR) repeat protein